jgi:hypothetical protein
VQTAAVPIALAWLNKYHRKGFDLAIASILDLAIENLFDSDNDLGFKFLDVSEVLLDPLRVVIDRNFDCIQNGCFMEFPLK